MLRTNSPATASNPVAWPQPVREYVERCFKAARPSQRPGLQQALRLIIQDAQTRGLLYSRPWGTLPPPNLNLSPDQAATVVINFGSAPRGSRFDVGPPPMPGVAPMAGLRPVPSHMPPGIPRPSMVSAFSIPGGVSTHNMSNRKRCMDEGLVTSSQVKKRHHSTQHDTQGGSYAADEHARRLERVGRFKGDGATAVGAVATGKGSRQKKPQLVKKNLQNQNVPDNTLSIDWDRYAISGTCKTLEKAYFRLTSAPDPSTVRPAQVLRKALSRLVGLIASGDVNYFYSQDQFKGMRQDCVVQALKGDLPIAIYEAHARAALEYGDTAEYNQCQGQLRGLYTSKTRKAEFIAYRILYQSVFWFLNRNKGEIVVGLLESLGDAEGVADNANVFHALQVRQALVSSNYSAFFRLYDAAPALGRALMDLAVPKLRFACVEGFMKAFKMRLEVGDFLCTALGFLSSMSERKFDSPKTPFYQPGCSRYSTGEFEGKYRPLSPDDREEAVEECVEFLDQCGVAFFPSEGRDGDQIPMIDCKQSLGSLRMPEEKDAVAHGDAALDLNDFLKSF